MGEKLGRIVSRRVLVNRNIKAAGAFVLAKNTNRVLWLLRGDDTYSNTWGLSGGRVENDETVMDCLVREIQEETGYTGKIIRTIPVELFESADGHFEYHTFVCLIAKEFIPILSSEHKGYCWSSIDCFPKPLHPGLWNSISDETLQRKISTINDILKIAS